jgi:hypothetical protein
MEFKSKNGLEQEDFRTVLRAAERLKPRKEISNSGFSSMKEILDISLSFYSF